MKSDDTVNVKNPKDGRVHSCTFKLYDSVYRDKGFELITRKTVADNQEKEKGRRGRPPASSAPTGSAAEIAARLGMTDDAAGNAAKDVTRSGNAANDVTAGDNAAKDATGPTDENKADIDLEITPDRPSAGRDRIRSKSVGSGT